MTGLREITSTRYQIIYADPPWAYSCKHPTASKGGARGNGYSSGVNYYYETLSLDELKKMPVNKLAEDNSILYLWAVNPLLPEAFDLMQTWGFKYKTLITWHKLSCKGMGYWFRGHTEHLLFGIKGNIRAFRSLEHNIKSIKVSGHSKKPEEFRQMIENASPAFTKKLELFARPHSPLFPKREGWDVWGNEVESDIDFRVA